MARLVIALVWMAAIGATVVTSFATRSAFAEVNPAGGVFIVATCAAVAALSARFIRVLPALLLTAILAGLVASVVAWGVLRDESSTAAVGVLAPPIWSGLVAAVGVTASRVLDSRRAHPQA